MFDAEELTDEQLAILADWEDDGRECWYRHPEFAELLKEGNAEFELLRSMAQELVSFRKGECC
jgi:hypothetical protein